MKRSTAVGALLLPAASFQAAQGQGAGGEAAAVQKIEKAGGSVRKIAQNDDHQEADFHLQGASVIDADLAPLSSIANLVHLHLGRTSITDAGLAHIKPLTKLTELHLDQTKITDKGLAQLKGLTALTYLNLYGTAITDAGLDQLRGLVNLKSLYLWQTKVTPDGVEKLKKALPKTDIVMGWDAEQPKKP